MFQLREWITGLFRVQGQYLFSSGSGLAKAIEIKTTGVLRVKETRVAWLLSKAQFGERLFWNVPFFQIPKLAARSWNHLSLRNSFSLLCSLAQLLFCAELYSLLRNMRNCVNIYCMRALTLVLLTSVTKLWYIWFWHKIWNGKYTLMYKLSIEKCGNNTSGSIKWLF